jgi:hypothetical protein
MTVILATGTVRGDDRVIVDGIRLDIPENIDDFPREKAGHVSESVAPSY